jgi:hypothetical protein
MAREHTDGTEHYDHTFECYRFCYQQMLQHMRLYDAYSKQHGTTAERSVRLKATIEHYRANMARLQRAQLENK